ncbi:MAG: RNA polymerase-binding protein RbpA [Actinocatenispora sp.]
MVSGNAIRGTRVGGGPVRWSERGEPAPRRHVTYWCANEHEIQPLFSSDAAVPDTWDCPRCGLPGGQDREHPPERPRTEPYKTHLAYVKERRSETDGAAILAEALAKLREKRRP